MTTVPAVKGKIGITDFYQCTMNAKDLVARTEPVSEHFTTKDYEEMGERGKLQRDLDKRYLTEITPYLLRNHDRFFNSIVVHLDANLCRFKSLSTMTLPVGDKNISIMEAFPFDYADDAKRIGFLQIKDTGSMYILDGQHRMAALRAARNPSEEERKTLTKNFEKNNELHLLKDNNTIKQDQLSVLFVDLKGKKEQRTLFCDINTYARKIAKGPEIGMSERNGYYKIIQNMLDENSVFSSPKWVVQSGSSLPDGSQQFTTKKHLSTIVTNILKFYGYDWRKDVLPAQEEFKKGEKIAIKFLDAFVTKIDAYKLALSQDPTSNELPKLRRKENKGALLYKPLPQVALAEAILHLIDKSDLDEPAIYRAINKIDWSFKKGSQFENTLMTIDGNILTGKKVQARLRDMIIYWVVGPSKAGKVLTDDRLEELTQEWQDATGQEGSIPKVINA